MAAVTFSNVSGLNLATGKTMDAKFDKDANFPTLNVHRKIPISIEDWLNLQKPEVKQMEQEKALQRAYQLLQVVSEPIIQSGLNSTQMAIVYSGGDAGKTTANCASSITVGTDCSGMETPLTALSNLGVKYLSKFCCDNEREVLKSIKANFRPEVICADIQSRDHQGTPKVDRYIAGFPCQPFSTAGKQQGFQE